MSVHVVLLAAHLVTLAVEASPLSNMIVLTNAFCRSLCSTVCVVTNGAA